MGKGEVMPRSARVSTKAGSTPRSAKVVVMLGVDDTAKCLMHHDRRHKPERRPAGFKWSPTLGHMGSPADFERRVIGALADPPANWVVAVAGPHGPPLSVGDPHSSFPLASVTKPLSAAALWLAVEEGTVNWDDHVGPPGSTLAHLLAHASGLPLELSLIHISEPTRPY